MKFNCYRFSFFLKKLVITVYTSSSNNLIFLAYNKKKFPITKILKAIV